MSGFDYSELWGTNLLKELRRRLNELEKAKSRLENTDSTYFKGFVDQGVRLRAAIEAIERVDAGLVPPKEGGE